MSHAVLAGPSRARSSRPAVGASIAIGWRLLIAVNAVALLLGGSEARALDLSGHWRVEMTGASSAVQIAQVTQVGNTVSVTLVITGLTIDFTGTATSTAVSLQADPTDVPCPTGGGLRVLPGENVLDGRFAAFSADLCNPPSFWRVLATRCTCFDGN